ncbi:Nn.00g043010.m01.CDS01 [Neocucurbitaria sp. VM-36]
MSSLMDLVSQNQPHFQTHQALLVIGLQNDFVLPDGRLPVNIKKGFLERIQTLIPKFRELNGNVIWVQTLYEADRIATDANTGEGDALVVGGLIDGEESSTEGGDEEPTKGLLPPAQSRSSKHKQRALDLLKRVSARRKTIPQEEARASAEQDDELFLLKTEKKTPACIPNTHGAEFADVIARQFELPADMVIRTTNYSAFQGTSLLMTLRAKLVTEVYICGCITNVSVLATVIDAARHGVKINVVEDCLGYRKRARHELALKRMEDFFDAYLVNSTDILAREPPATPPQKQSTSPNGSRKGSKGSDKPIEALVGKLSLTDDRRPTSRSSNPRSPTRVLTGKQRTLSLVSVAESRKASSSTSTPAAEPTTRPAAEPITEPASEPTDKDFADMLVKGAKVPGAKEQSPETGQKETNLVKTKIRMRSRPRKKKKEKDGKASEEKDEEASRTKTEPVPGNGEPSTAARHDPAEPVTATGAAKSEPTEAQRTSLMAKAGSVADLRERDSRQQALKSVASVPVLASRPGNEEKEKNRLSDFSDRVRLSFSRTPKTEPNSDAKNERPSTPTKLTSTSIQGEEKAAKPVPAKSSELATTQTSSPASAQPTPTTPSSTTRSNGVGKTPKLQSLATLPVLGPGDTIAEGDSRILYDFFPADLRHPSDTSKPLKDLIFTQLYNEVRWQKMLHQQGEVPRLVCCQGAFGEDGSMPVYRHPTDQTLPLLHFSPKVQVIRKQAEKLVGHPLNHVLIQLYRSGNDFISEHSDKTLDIVKGSSIVNVSFGAQRTMRLRTKKSSKDPDDNAEDITQRETQRVAMPHNSMLAVGLKSNEKWLHGIMPDKRLPSERSDAEKAYNGIRISLTFRHIGTFLDAKETTIWGQGATSKHQRDAADVIHADAAETSRLIRAFSHENHSTAFDWATHYGSGFDVLHLSPSSSSNPPPDDLPLLFASNNPIETAQARICLSEAKIKYTLVDAPTLDTTFELDRQVSFRDTDTSHAEISLASGILLYIDRYYPLDRDADRSKACTAAAYPIMLLAGALLKAWMNRHVPTYRAEVESGLACLEEALEREGGPYIAGGRFSVADCFVWPVLDEVVRGWEGWRGDGEERFPGLSRYYEMTWRKKGSVRKVREKLAEREGPEREGGAVKE